MIASMIFLGSFGPTEWVLILVVVLLLFGGRKIPELMKGLGSGIKEFKNAAKDDTPSKPVSSDPIQPSSPLNDEPKVHKE
ncbi:twin-arginine translocase TatA/TatE family subunit [Flavobacterium aurantiibacter]|uniref:Sec-independent protein translocase protein TatA n=1 Tax=Flavobacterium aurantiibacter TaxID=2023067 RepID=A0A255ZKV8_9FLAO|nr:twin-arginine translocase TatA/TatE family subunit [Flavobacterium aurantiibacter]OYQ41544.1 twin-arginine translocase TatA/TatE family subunit [Flavobacterium aurantiibacter]